MRSTSLSIPPYIAPTRNHAAMTATTAPAAQMVKREFTVRFLTPAFLGDADQNARWRTPPFKHLLREWWRVAYAAERGYRFDVTSMRHEEGLLFGHAWLEDDFTTAPSGRRVKTARQSAVRMRLLAERDHSVISTTEAANIWQGETASGVAPMGTDPSLGYSWFGLIKRGDGSPDRQRVEPKAVRRIALAYPTEHSSNIDTAITLIHAFGTVGTRSRGGWGSVHVDQAPAVDREQLVRFSQPLSACLMRDWAAAVACDEDGTPWVWKSCQTFASWDKALATAARIRREVRSSLPKPQRVALGFASSGRMPSPLRWKVIAASGQLRLQAAALPHRIPDDGGNSLSERDLVSAWTEVRARLNERLQPIT